METIVLCAKTNALLHPEHMGLPGVDVQSEPWLKVFSSAAVARNYLRGEVSVFEVWVASSDDIEAINLAAALKKDVPNRVVCLVCPVPGGSTLSRAHRAGIDAVLSAEAFSARFVASQLQYLQFEEQHNQKRLEANDLHEKEDNASQAHVQEGLGGCTEGFLCEAREEVHVQEAIGEASGAHGEADAQEVMCEASEARGETQEECLGKPEARLSQLPELKKETQNESLTTIGTNECSLDKNPSDITHVLSGSEALRKSASTDDVAALASLESTLHILPVGKVVSPQTRSQKSSATASSFDEPGSSAEGMAEGSSRATFVLPVLSATGGVGKSIVSAMCALQCELRGLKTLLIDADLQFGDMSLLFPQMQTVSFEDFLEGRFSQTQGNNVELFTFGKRDVLANAATAELPAKNPSGLTVVRALSRAERAETAIRQLPKALANARGKYDVVIINSGAFWTEEHAALLEQSSKALLLLGQRPASVHACKRALELCKRCNIATSLFTVALNRCDKDALYTPADISSVLQGMTVHEIREGGEQVEECFLLGQADELLIKRNPFAVSLSGLLDSVLPAHAGGAIKVQAPRSESRHKRLRIPFSLIAKKEVACLS